MYLDIYVCVYIYIYTYIYIYMLQEIIAQVEWNLIAEGICSVIGTNWVGPGRRFCLCECLNCLYMFVFAYIFIFIVKY